MVLSPRSADQFGTFCGYPYDEDQLPDIRKHVLLKRSVLRSHQKYRCE
jgi:hypothetical protein